MVLFLWFYFHQARVLRLTIYKLYFFSIWSLDSFADKWGREKILVSEYAGKHESPKQSLKSILQMVSLFFISTWQTAHGTPVFLCLFMQPKVRDTPHTDFSYRWYSKCSSNMCSYKGRRSEALNLDAKIKNTLMVEIFAILLCQIYKLWQKYMTKCRTGQWSAQTSSNRPPCRCDRLKPLMTRNCSK